MHPILTPASHLCPFLPSASFSKKGSYKRHLILTTSVSHLPTSLHVSHHHSIQGTVILHLRYLSTTTAPDLLQKHTPPPRFILHREAEVIFPSATPIRSSSPLLPAKQPDSQSSGGKGGTLSTPQEPRSYWLSGRVIMRPKWTRQVWEALLSPGPWLHPGATFHPHVRLRTSSISPVQT